MSRPNAGSPLLHLLVPYPTSLYKPPPTPLDQPTQVSFRPLGPRPKQGKQAYIVIGPFSGSCLALRRSWFIVVDVVRCDIIVVGRVIVGVLRHPADGVCNAAGQYERYLRLDALYVWQLCSK